MTNEKWGSDIDMAGILYDARRIKAYEGLLALGEIAEETKQWCDDLWEELVFDAELLDESGR